MTRAINKPEPCSVEGCTKPVRSRGLCNMHTHRVRRLGSTKLPKRGPAKVQKTCQTCGSPYDVVPYKAQNSHFCSLPCLHKANGERQRVVTSTTFFDWAQSKEGCWEWPFSRNRYGYGKCRLLGETVAHRVAYVLTRGPIPLGYLVCHRCDNPPCVRPDHLFLGTQQDNTADRDAKGRTSHGERRPSSKLTADDARAIRNDGRSSRQLAREYGVSGTTVLRIKKRQIWRHA